MSDSTQTNNFVMPDEGLVKKMLKKRNDTKVRMAKHYTDNRQLLNDRRKSNRVLERERKEEKYKSGELERPKIGRPKIPEEERQRRKEEKRLNRLKTGPKAKRILAKTQVEGDRIVVVVQNPSGKPIEYRYVNTPDVKVITAEEG